MTSTLLEETSHRTETHPHGPPPPKVAIRGKAAHRYCYHVIGGTAYCCHVTVKSTRSCAAAYKCVTVETLDPWTVLLPSAVPSVSRKLGLNWVVLADTGDAILFVSGRLLLSQCCAKGVKEVGVYF